MSRQTTLDTVKAAMVLLAEAHYTAAPNTPMRRPVPVGATEPYFAADAVLGAVETIQALERESAWLLGYATRLCNGYQTYDFKWDQAAADRDEAQAEKHKAKVRKLLEPYGVGCHIGGDPRGSVFSLSTPKTARSNGWDQGRWHV